MTLLQQALEALQNTIDCLMRENEKNDGPICDTIWYDDHTTLFDYINCEIAALRKAIEQGAVVVQGQHKTYIDLEQRLADAIADDNSQSAARTLGREETIYSRDIMAASLVLPEDLSRQTGRVLAGPEPYDGLELIKWWARAKARLRYIEVDAMLEERDK